MNELVGKTILGIRLDAEEQHYLAFDTDAGPVAYGVSGDCCSESWFADVVGVQALLGHRVVSAEDIEMPDAPIDGRSRQDEDSQYGYKITTPGGVCDVVFRCSSNGYYGGNLYFVTGDLHDVKWQAITDDYPC